MIRDTSSQDKQIASTPQAAQKRWLGRAAIGVVAVAVLGALVAAWAGTSHSVNASRLRIAEVARGTLVRDAAVTGRVVAAVNPTLYAPATALASLRCRMVSAQTPWTSSSGVATSWA